MALTSAATTASDAPTALDISSGEGPAPGTRHWAWARLMERAFGGDVLACPQCGGRLALIATIDDLHAIRAILARLGLPTEAPHPDPPRPPPAGSPRLLADILA